MFNRTKMILGEEKALALRDKHILVVGIGGVGGYSCEALVRSGIGKITIIDDDSVSESNINRQIIALNSNVGKLKVDIMEERLKDINPEILVHKIGERFSEDFLLDLNEYDYIIDAIDSIESKINLINRSFESGTKIISSMGMGKRIHPEKLEVAFLKDTYNCPIAKKLRKNLNSDILKNLKVVFSKEESINTDGVGSMIFVPATCGIIMASEVISDISNL